MLYDKNNIKKKKLNIIKEYIYNLNNEINILNTKIISFNRKKLIYTTITKLLSFISTIIGIIVIGSIHNTNLIIMLFTCISLITINILINDYINKALNNKYNIYETKELIRDKKVLLNQYKSKEKILINELNIIKEDYSQNKETVLSTDNINKDSFFKDINYNTIPKSKKKIKKS